MKFPSQAPVFRNRFTAFFRRRAWQAWSRTYLEATPESCRGAWVQAVETGPSLPKRRLALVRDIFLGGLQMQSWERYESGTILHVNLFAGDVGVPVPTLAVRVLRAWSAQTGPQWAFSCAFCPLTEAKAN